MTAGFRFLRLQRCRAWRCHARSRRIGMILERIGRRDDTLATACPYRLSLPIKVLCDRVKISQTINRQFSVGVVKRIFPVSRRYEGVAPVHRSSSVLAFLKDWGETGRRRMFSLNPRIGPPMGKSQNPGVARPLLFSPESFRGRDARARGSLNLRNQVLSLAGRDARAQVSPTSGTRSSPSQGETERVFLAGGRRSSSGERQRDREGLPTRRVCLCAKGGFCEGVVACH